MRGCSIEDEHEDEFEEDGPIILEQSGEGSNAPARLIFLDESGVQTNLTRLRGRRPQGHW